MDFTTWAEGDPVEFNILEMEPFRVSLDETTQVWSMEIAMKISMRWEDARLKTSACAAKLMEMLSLYPGVSNADRLAREADRGHIWQPAIEVNGSSLSYKPDTSAASGATKNEVSEALFAFNNPLLNTNVAWMTGKEGSPGSDGAAMLNMSFTWNIGIKPTLKFSSYPFDEQSFGLSFGFGKGVNVFSCENLFTDQRSALGRLATAGKVGDPTDGVLPTTNEYKLFATNGYVAKHPDLPDGSGKDRTKCQISFNVRRESFIVFIKVILPTVLVVYLGLLSVFLSAADHSGDRAALLGVSILICVINLERDTGLGKLMYSTWFDIFNIFQLGIQVVALVEGLVEHKLMCWGNEAECLMLNKVWSWLILTSLYPLLTISIILGGAKLGTIAAILQFVVVPLSCLLAAFEFRRRLLADAKRRKIAAKKLANTDRDSEDFSQVFEEAFEAYDLDSSGSLDAEEIRTLIKAIFGKNKEDYTKAMDTARAVATQSGGELSLEACEDVFDKLEQAGLFATRAASGGGGGRTLKRQNTSAIDTKNKGGNRILPFGGKKKPITVGETECASVAPPTTTSVEDVP